MVWLIGLGCLLTGAVIGAVMFKLLMSDEAKIRALEEQLQTLSEEHESYKSNVHSHFSNSAQLLGKLTESYRDVFLHMAEGARSLCPDYISSQISLNADSRSLLGQADARSNAPLAPPLDYAARTEPARKPARNKDDQDEDYDFESESTQH
ncbi:MAG: YhcB family protein [Burkholderiales bacterium]